jgi:hypothetical protein
MPLRFEAEPELGEQLAQTLRTKFAVSRCGQNVRLLPNSTVTIRNPRGETERRLDGQVSPKTVDIWEIIIPAEPARSNPTDGIATAQDREERKRRLFQTKRSIVGA